MRKPSRRAWRRSCCSLLPRGGDGFMGFAFREHSRLVSGPLTRPTCSSRIPRRKGAGYHSAEKKSGGLPVPGIRRQIAFDAVLALDRLGEEGYGLLEPFIRLGAAEAQ